VKPALSKKSSLGRSERAVVVTPVFRETLGSDDWPALRSIREHLAAYDHYAVVPRRLAANCPGGFPRGRVIAFEDRYFTGPMSYNKLLFSRDFFAAFERYEFMLLAQLDTIVLSDQLAYWCDRGFDFIGAPWSGKYRSHSKVDTEKVGNGGFSLRHISAALRVLGGKISRRPDYTLGPKPSWWHWQRLRKIVLLFGQARALFPRVTVESFLKKHFLTNEDVFWGVYAKQLDPSFKVADEVTALHFAFETDPRESLLRTGKLPFGCHGWAKYGRDFWEEVLPETVPRALAASL